MDKYSRSVRQAVSHDGFIINGIVQAVKPGLKLILSIRIGNSIAIPIVYKSCSFGLRPRAIINLTFLADIPYLEDSGTAPVTVSKLARHANLSITLSAYHKMSHSNAKFEEQLIITNKMPLPQSGIDLIDQSRAVVADAKSMRVIKHTVLIVSFKKAA